MATVPTAQIERRDPEITTGVERNESAGARCTSRPPRHGHPRRGATPRPGPPTCGSAYPATTGTPDAPRPGGPRRYGLQINLGGTADRPHRDVDQAPATFAEHPNWTCRSRSTRRTRPPEGAPAGDCRSLVETHSGVGGHRSPRGAAEDAHESRRLPRDRSATRALLPLLAPCGIAVGEAQQQPWERQLPRGPTLVGERPPRRPGAAKRHRSSLARTRTLVGRAVQPADSKSEANWAGVRAASVGASLMVCNSASDTALAEPAASDYQHPPAQPHVVGLGHECGHERRRVDDLGAAARCPIDSEVR